MENTVSTLIDSTAVEAIGTELKTNISAVAPAILGVMAITIVASVIFKFIRRFTSK